MTVKVTGFRDLNRKLERLAKGLPASVVRQALREGAQVIADEAKRLAPVDTGALRDSIAVTDDRDGKLYGRPGVEGGVSVYVGPVGSTDDGDVYYAKFVEFGTARHVAQPFMRPAIQGRRDEAGRVTIAALAAAVRKAAE
ncbi:hypothetical protein ASE90_01745 [Sphingomonas sp. Leaf67]|uniref:HK97-gp10 family putative phage morphogenesis protein n=1 Tax=Sphingomonas sp. Leaf67 TaxID=1736230 RepID=UPI0006FFE49E|nr:HK97-gp10 family putative phage morphogenesis protein [Sphingomonas sp. Leaf67]KQN91554.1 hypothetical protein ASE90_01745 [Sphingomonas sp. Leaf67]